LIIVEDIEQEVVATFKVNILRGSLKIVVFKAQGSVNTRANTLEIAIREEVGFVFDKARKDGAQGGAAKVYGMGLPYTSKNWPQQGVVLGWRNG